MHENRAELLSGTTEDNRLEWIEPTVLQLDVRETATNPARGLDYGLYYRTGPHYPDCTRS